MLVLAVLDFEKNQPMFKDTYLICKVFIFLTIEKYCYPTTR
jgi:hypothetical protein